MIQRQEKQLLLARSHQKPSKINCLGKRQKKEQSWREKRILEWGYGKARCIVGWRAGFQWHASISRQRSILIQDTRPLNSCICQPQQRNIHGCISGGFFMRKAFWADLLKCLCICWCGTVHFWSRWCWFP